MEPQDTNTTEPRPWCGPFDRSTAPAVAALVAWVVGQGRYSAAVFIRESTKVSLTTGLEARVKGKRGEEDVRVLWQVEPCAYITWEDGDQEWILDSSIYDSVQVVWDGHSLIVRFGQKEGGHIVPESMAVVRIWTITPEHDPKWKSIPEERVREMMDVMAATTRLGGYTSGAADALSWFLGVMSDEEFHYRYMHGGTPSGL